MRVAALKSQYDNKQQQLERELSEARKRLQALEKQMTAKQVSWQPTNGNMSGVELRNYFVCLE